MAARDPDKGVQQPFLDRLLDYEPRIAADTPLTRDQQIRQLKASLRRDLEWLLNTRRTPDRVPEAYRHLSDSVYNYGLPDTGSFALLSSREQQRFLRALESTIARFESRLQMVRVSMQAPGPNTRVLRFHIDGLLKIDPAPERICFDTVLQLTSGEYEVEREYAPR
jgi:type VI secretion system protein ImpF